MTARPMARPATPRTGGSSRSGLRTAVRHYLEMLVAMIVGMGVLMAVQTVLSAAGLPTSLGTEGDLLLMATAMAVPMAAWMRWRGHRWAPTIEMSASMYVAFGVLFVPMWLGLMTPDEVMLWGHVLMLPAMAGAMLLRPREYTGADHRH